MTTDELRQCSFCGDPRVFSQPDCVDAHDSDCPEWVCVDCGTAYFLGQPAAVGELVSSGAA